MTTATDVVNAVQAALDTAQDFAGVPKTSDQIAALQAQVTQLNADKATLQSNLDAANASVSSLQAKIDAAKTAAQADKDADAANVAGQGVLDALA